MSAKVLNLLGANLTHAEIGQRLFISVRTVESHVAALRRKLAIPDHRTLVRLAAEHRSEAGGRGTAPPMPLTSFVGRAGDLETLAVAMAGARLVTVTGPGGVGKTRLAIAAAAAQASRFGNGVRWVDLVPIATTADLEDAVAAACDATPTSRRSPAEAIVAAVRDQVTLLVLDNCEHLATAVAVLAERLLARCPGLTILLTSRVRLAVAFERVVALPGLPASDGVALFTERAAAAGADLAEARPERVAAICAALGGLPLAIELAAVRLPALALSGVEAGLVDQAGLLTGGARGDQAPVDHGHARLERRPADAGRGQGAAPDRGLRHAVRPGQRGGRGRVPAAGHSRDCVGARGADRPQPRGGGRRCRRAGVPAARTGPPVRHRHHGRRGPAVLLAAPGLVPAFGPAAARRPRPRRCQGPRRGPGRPGLGRRRRSRPGC
ncbi:MAG: ATP-binding protein [Streptosporangiaceae bacterium]